MQKQDQLQLYKLASIFNKEKSKIAVISCTPVSYLLFYIGTLQLETYPAYLIEYVIIRNHKIILIITLSQTFK